MSSFSSHLTSPHVASSGDPLLDDPLYSRLKHYVVESTGLTYYADKDLDFARRVSRRLSTTGLADCASYFELLRDPLRGASELDALISEIAIGETYFFRHPEHFDALRDHVLPDLISRNRLTCSLRIWCAGCADGPEPYSLAILLKQEMADLLAGWNVTILGTDMNRGSLVRAREGQFAEWALRATPEPVKHQCFSKEGNLWNLKPDYKKAVSFQFHNLVEHPFPSIVHNLSAFDLIVCRNVMIYFGPELMQRMIRQFHQSLVPGAWLLVGPAEPNMHNFTSFRTVNLPGLTLYQKPSVETAAIRVEENIAPLKLPQRPEVPATNGSHTLARHASRENVDATLALARSHADRGAWEDAAGCCRDLLAQDSLNSRAHFYLGLVLEQMRKHSQAEESLRRAIYLDRQSVLAHYYLGLVLQSRSEARQAVGCFENALRLLDSTPSLYSFPEVDDITAGELKELAAMHLGILRERICKKPV